MQSGDGLFIQPIDYALAVWFALAAYVTYDQWWNNLEPNAMRAGIAPVTLYIGPIGLLLYVSAEKEPKPGTHKKFVKPIWKQGIGSTIHCAAEDPTPEEVVVSA